VTIAADEHLRKLPKVELHCHLEGSIRATTLATLSARNGLTLPVADPVDLFRFTSLNHFLSVYDVVCASLRTAEDFRQITYEALEDAARSNVRYREMFFSPGHVIALGVPVDVVWEGIEAGLAEGQQDFDVRCRMILDVTKPMGASHAQDMIEFAATKDRDDLIGVGGDSVEAGTDHYAFIPAFTAAAKHGLRRTMHAGEDGPAENIRISIDELGCERIDHGYHLLDDALLTKRMVEDRVPVTVCPTSNVVIANRIKEVGEHPIARQREQGVLVSLNSDDPGMMQFTLADEFVACSTAFDWDLETMEQLSLDALESSWAPPDEKVRWQHQFGARFDELRTEYSLPPRRH
jgi:adenosine deaminase